MAYHFSANQFEDKYSPRKLGNWEYPKWYPDRPRQRYKTTRIIADDNGRLLDGIRRENPWGNYKNTWDLPRRITREYVEQLNAPPQRLINAWGKKKKGPQEQAGSQLDAAKYLKPETPKGPKPETPKAAKPETPKSPKSEADEQSLKKTESRCKMCCKKFPDCTCYKDPLKDQKDLQGKTEPPSTPPAPAPAPAPPEETESKDEEEISCSTNDSQIVVTPCNACNHLPILNVKHTTPQESFDRRNKSCSALDLRPKAAKLEPLNNLQEKEEKLHKIQPGALDEKIKSIIDSVVEKPKSKVSPDEICKEVRAFPRRSKEKLGAIRPAENFREDYEEGAYLNCLEKHNNNFESVAIEIEDEEPKIDCEPEREEKQTPKSSDSVKMKESKTTPQRLSNGVSGFQIAKRYHDENLKHKPLPDVIDDPVFKALNVGRHPNPGAALQVQPLPSAIGWKHYTTPGPTECSKLRVYRPKTALDKMKLQKELRPKTGISNTTLKKRFLPIDLAICWDLKPDDPSDEPKRSPHIDGSNGSIAPAVFTMIKPKECFEEDENIPGSSQAVAERIQQGIEDNNIANLPSQVHGKRTPMHVSSNREAIMSCVRSPQGETQKYKTGSPESLNSITPNAAEYARKNPKTAWTNLDTSKELSDRLMTLQKENCINDSKSPGKFSTDSLQIRKKKLHQSTPNLTTVCEGSHCGTEKSSSGSSKSSSFSKTRNCGSASASVDRKNIVSKEIKNGKEKTRSCSACEKGNSQMEEVRERPEFKAAFKAGVPKSEGSNSGSSGGSKSYKVPKMRLPYAKKSYSINTLAPPFSIWRENNGQEYPEHWRLASVYQHSYKPINSRKRPLLASVFQ